MGRNIFNFKESVESTIKQLDSIQVYNNEFKASLIQREAQEGLEHALLAVDAIGELNKCIDRNKERTLSDAKEGCEDIHNTASFVSGLLKCSKSEIIGESFGLESINSPLDKVQAGIEGIGDFIKKIIDKIKEFLKYIWNAIKKFFKAVFGKKDEKADEKAERLKAFRNEAHSYIRDKEFELDIVRGVGAIIEAKYIQGHGTEFVLNSISRYIEGAARYITNSLVTEKQPTSEIQSIDSEMQTKKNGEVNEAINNSVKVTRESIARGVGNPYIKDYNTLTSMGLNLKSLGLAYSKNRSIGENTCVFGIRNHHLLVITKLPDDDEFKPGENTGLLNLDGVKLSEMTGDACSVGFIPVEYVITPDGGSTFRKHVEEALTKINPKDYEDYLNNKPYDKIKKYLEKIESDNDKVVIAIVKAEKILNSNYSDGTINVTHMKKAIEGIAKELLLYSKACSDYVFNIEKDHVIDIVNKAMSETGGFGYEIGKDKKDLKDAN